MSWTEREENGTLVGHGVAFVLMTILQQRFNFTFEIVLPERNIVFDRKSELSLIGLVNSSVCIYIILLIYVIIRCVI